MRYEYRGDEPGIKARMGRAPRPFDPALCGTNKGLWQHRRDGIPKCDKCAAHEYVERKKNRHKKGAEVGLVQGGRQTPFIPKTAQDPT